MKKKLLSCILTLCMLSTIIVVMPVTANAATFDIYTYEVSDGKATITDCDTSAFGSITIPSTLGGYPVTSIGYAAFGGCSSLTSITIPDSVTSIDYAAFKRCSSLTSIIIPHSVTSIDDDVFYNCSSLTSINVNENNKYYCSVDGDLFNKSKNKLIQYAMGKEDTSYIIPDSVTYIGNSAFRDCSSLTSITMPNSVTSIGDNVFEDCSSLTSITIPNSVTSIGSSAFYNCSSLTDVYYIGSEEQWKSISIGSSNSYFTNANIHYISPININYTISSIGSVWKTATATPSTDITLATDVPSRTGHTFLGWATTANATAAKYQPGDTITLGTEDINLYAVWEKTTYTETKKVNGIFMVTPTDVPTGSSIMLVCYKGGELVYIGKFEYDGSATVPFFVNAQYDEVKVFVWENTENMIPVTEPEAVPQL